MDYKINNEAVAACVAAQLVRNGCKSLSTVVGLTNLLMHEKERKRLLSTDNEKEIATITGQLDGGLLTIIMNSLVLMIQGGCMTFEEGDLSLTQFGISMCEQMKDRRSKMLSNILRDMPAIMEKTVRMKENMFDQRYVIAL